ncbi:MAG: Gfo/Idh/MocA family oxidoreductase [Clostridia bacterium]
MLRTGILGCGSIAEARHGKEIFENKHCELKACYDPIAKRARDLAKKFGGKAVSSVEAVIMDPDIDAIIVCTPNKYHAPYSIMALEAKKHVLCEKPMAVSLQEAGNMIKAAEKNDRKLMIGHNQRLVPAHKKAREIIHSGKLGKILTFSTTFGHGGAEKWSMTKGPDTWFFNREEAVVGAMGDLGVHKTDLMRWLLNEEFCEARAFTATLDKKYKNDKPIDVDDNALCILRTPSGITGTLTVSWTYYGGGDNSTIIHGEKGALRIFANPKWPIEIFYADKKVERIAAGTIQTNEKQTHSGVMDLFVDSVLNDKPVEISGHEGYKALEIILACMESSAKGTTVKF